MASSPEQINKNYKSQFSHHIRCFLKSGLILDDEMDFIMTLVGCDDEHDESNSKLSILQKILMGFSATSTVLFALHQRHAFIYVPLTVTPLLFLGVPYYSQELYCKTQRDNVESFVKNVVNISKLNRSLCQYFQFRKEQSSTAGNLINLYTELVQSLVNVVFIEERSLLIEIKTTIKDLGNAVPFIKSDYAYLDNINLHEFSIANVKNVDDCVTYLNKLSDIFVLIASNFLTCLTIICCSQIWSSYNIDVDQVVDSYMPVMKILSRDCHKNINQKFKYVKFFYINCNNGEASTSGHKPCSAVRVGPREKLRLKTFNIMEESSLILEKSEMILNKLQGSDLRTSEEKEIMHKCIGELRSNVHEYHESLTILLKLYELHINRLKPPELLEKGSSDSAPGTSESTEVIPFVEPESEDKEGSDDEQFECYVGAIQDADEIAAACHYEEEYEYRKYAVAVATELNQKLRKNEKFVAARKKRGFAVEEETEAAQSTAEKAPKGNEKAEGAEVEETEEENKTDLETQSKETDINLNPPFPFIKLPSPPPPPPVPCPLPNCDDFLEEFFISIRNAAQQRGNNVEEVFGNVEEFEN